MPIVHLAFEVVPRTPGQEAYYRQVEAALKAVQESGLRYAVGPLETTVEGELDDVLAVVSRAHKAVAAAGADHIHTVIKIDYDRGGPPLGLDQKMRRIAAFNR